MKGLCIEVWVGFRKLIIEGEVRGLVAVGRENG